MKISGYQAPALDPNGELDAILSFGGLIAWRHLFGETARLNVGVSGLFIDKREDLGGGLTSSFQSVYRAAPTGTSQIGRTHV